MSKNFQKSMNLCSEKIEFIVFWYIEKVCCRETWLAQGEYFTTMGCGPSVLAKPYAEFGKIGLFGTPETA